MTAGIIALAVVAGGIVTFLFWWAGDPDQPRDLPAWAVFVPVAAQALLAVILLVAVRRRRSGR